MIEPGKTVKVHYKGTLEDGTVFDTSEGQPPLAFEVGAGNVIPGFDAAVAGMDLDETKTITIPCAEAYGDVRDDMIGEIPRDNLPAEIEPEVGMMLQMQSPQGDIPVRIIGVTDEAVTLDANHPLAGKDLTFELTVVEIS